MSQRPRPEAKHYPSCAIAFGRKHHAARAALQAELGVL